MNPVGLYGIAGVGPLLKVNIQHRSWFKGADTVVVLKFLNWKFQQILASDVNLRMDVRRYLEEIANNLHHTDEFMTGLYNSGLFIPPLRLGRIVRHGLEMLGSFAKCAATAYKLSLPRFKFNPKFHMLCHLILEMQEALANKESALNPTSFSCQMPEDFINKCATLSRSVDARAVAERTVDLYRVAVAGAW